MTTDDRADPRPPFGTGMAEFALALGGFALGTGEFASMGLLPNIAGELGTSIPRAGLGISAYALGVVVGAPAIAAANTSISPSSIRRLPARAKAAAITGAPTTTPRA